MPVISVNRQTVAKLAPGERPIRYFDASLKGFGVRVATSGERTFFLEYRPNGGGRGVAKRRLKLGRDSESFRADAARELAKAELAKVTLGGDPAADLQAKRTAETVAEVVELYLSQRIRPKRKPKTAKLFEGYGRTVVAALGTRKANLLSRAEVAKLHDSIGKAHPVTANRVVAFLKAAYGFSVKAGFLPEETANPCRTIELYRETGRERYLTQEELGRLGATLDLAGTTGLPWDPDPTKKSKHAPGAKSRRVVIDPHALAAIRLLVLTGARLREILHLRWEHVDFERGVLRLPDSKTGKKVIILGGPALEVLTRLPRMGVYVIAGHGPRKRADRLKVGHGERPRSDLNRPWARISKHAGLEGVRLHDLRHSFASMGAGAGLGLHVIGRLLGHSSQVTTARYAHLATDPAQRASDAIARAISDAMSGTLQREPE